MKLTIQLIRYTQCGVSRLLDAWPIEVITDRRIFRSSLYSMSIVGSVIRCYVVIHMHDFGSDYLSACMMQ